MSLNKEWKKIYKRSLAEINYNKVDPLEYKESLLNEINNHTENGMIGLLTGGTDCDGYRWLGYDIIKATLQSYNKWLKDNPNETESLDSYAKFTEHQRTKKERKTNDKISTILFNFISNKPYRKWCTT